MTDKEIIIDSIDVTRCEFCEWKNSNIPQCRVRLASFEPTCEGYNCYFKQHAKVKEELQTKKEECEELKRKLQEVKKDLNESNFDRNTAQIEVHQYKQTLDEVERCIKDAICEEECGINREYPCPDCDCSINNIIKIISKEKEK